MFQSTIKTQLLAGATMVAVLAHCAEAAEPRVDLEVAIESGFVPTDARGWTEMLNQAGFGNVRLRGDRGDSPSIETLGTEPSRSYKVVGLLTATNQLVLPKGKFGLNDRGPVAAWVQKLKDGGEDGINMKPAAFGLLPKQLIAVHEALATRLELPTLGQPAREVARQIADRLPYKFIADSAAQKALASDEVVADELNGLSSGTSLAAVFRPLGLVMFPEKNGPDIRLRIAPAASAKEFWPIGWPPKGNPSETLPEFFKYLRVEITDTPLSDAMLAISDRVKAPLLLDHNALARGKVDLQTKVNFPATNIFYARALDRLLFQARLKYELRVDESEKPFLWITTLRQ
jgi:hypothetical protein